MPTVSQHFERAEPRVRATYDALLGIARTLGDVVEDPKKTSIHLNRRSAFAGVATRKTALILTLKSPVEITSPRIGKREQASKNRWHNEIRLESAADLDAEVIAWLKQSWEMSA
ncbi:MAG: DUF5655 domain-containing protein [Gemmatimonadota bacterium]